MQEHERATDVHNNRFKVFLCLKFVQFVIITVILMHTFHIFMFVTFVLYVINIGFNI